MKKIITSLIIISIILLPLFTYNAYADNEYIKVKIASKNASESTVLYSDIGFYLYDNYDLGREIDEIRENTIIIEVNDDDIDILDKSNNYITSIPGDGSIVIGTCDYYDSIIKVDQNRYRDYITFLVRGEIYHTINYINMEKYLYGVVPREMGSNFPLEALKAQAVVARSFAYANINKHIGEGFNLCNTTDCQVYGGFDNEKESTTQAVIETFGEFVTYNGDIIETPYHSTSGGYTESSKNIWGGNLPYLVATEDSFSLNSPNSSWFYEISAAELQTKLASAGINVGELQDITLLDTTESNRVQNIKIKGTSGEKIISGNQFRNIIGATSLKSTLFSVNKNGNQGSSKVYVIDGNSFYPETIDINSAYIIDGTEYKGVNRGTVSRAISNDRTSSIGSTYSSKPLSFGFDGKGYGHGFGMSQYGAMEMAKQGYNYEEIIKHYYRGVEITNTGK